MSFFIVNITGRITGQNSVLSFGCKPPLLPGEVSLIVLDEPSDLCFNFKVHDIRQHIRQSADLLLFLEEEMEILIVGFFGKDESGLNSRIFLDSGLCSCWLDCGDNSYLQA